MSLRLKKADLRQNGCTASSMPKVDDNGRAGRTVAMCFLMLFLGYSMGSLRGPLSSLQTSLQTSFISPGNEARNSVDLIANTSDADTHKLLAHPSTIIPLLKDRFDWLDTISISPEPDSSSIDRARFAYLELLRTIVSGTAYGNAEKSVIPALGVQKNKVKDHLSMGKREGGTDWTYLGYTMTGFARLNKLRELWVDIFNNTVPGDFIETGVWRGGSSIYAKGILEAYNERDRQVYVCDSFSGLPPGDKSYDQRDKGWDNTPYLEVSQELVQGHFEEVDLMNENVHFVKGFFNDSMPVLRSALPPQQKFAIMRLDGDMYQSTVDVLYTLYDRLSIGGYLIMDDWHGFPSKTACEDFFQVHNFTPAVIDIDELSAYWKKTEEINIQYWRYEQKNFTL